MTLISCSKPDNAHPDSKPPMELKSGATAKGYYGEEDVYYEKITQPGGRVAWYRLEDD